MRLSSRIAAIGIVSAALLVAPKANAQLQVGSPIRITAAIGGTATVVGDHEPGVVATRGGGVRIAWIHDPEASHVSTRATVESADLDIATSTPTPMPGVNTTLPVQLALTMAGGAPLAVIGSPTAIDTPAWQVRAGRFGASTGPSLVDLDPGYALREISVPRTLRADTSGPSGTIVLPIGTVLRDAQQNHVAGHEVALDGASLMPVALPTSTMRYPAGSAFVAMRAAYLDGVQSGFFASLPMSHGPMGLGGFTMPAINTATALLAEPAFTNTADTFVHSLLMRDDGSLECSDYLASRTVSNCGRVANSVRDLDAVADPQNASDMWWTAGGQDDGQVSRLFVGDTAGVGEMQEIDITAFRACTHPRIAAILGEPVTSPQHAVVVASCSLIRAVESPHIFAWVIGRPAAAMPDAGVADVEADVTTTDVATVDAAGTDSNIADSSVSIDASTSSVNYRGGGCACRSAPQRVSREAGFAFVVFSLAITSVITRRRRRAAAPLRS